MLLFLSRKACWQDIFYLTMNVCTCTSIKTIIKNASLIYLEIALMQLFCLSRYFLMRKIGKVEEKQKII